MTKVEVLNTVTRSFHKIGFGLKKHSPEILVVAGVVGTVASAVLACKATTKLDGIVQEAKSEIEDIHYAAEHPETLKAEYTQEDMRKDITLTYVKTGVEIIKLYAPAVTLGAISLTGILASNNILRKRNVALAAAYAAVDKNFKSYRSRVIERFGDELDKELKYNLKKKEVEVTEVDENGNEKIVKKEVVTADLGPTCYSTYARFFDDGCKGWDKNSEFNLMFLNHQQNQANDLLRTKGYVFLNEVYEMLGIPKTQAGQVVGWYYDEKNPTGDNYIDFGIYDTYKEKARDFVNGYESTILLDFNVDGVISHLVEGMY